MPGARVPQHVGERLLHHAVRRGRHRSGHRVDRAVHAQRHVHGGAGRGHEVRDLRQPGRRCAIGAGLVVAQEPEERPQLVEHVTARTLYRLEGAARRLGPAVQHVRGRAGLDVDDRHRVRHAVVEIARDAQALLRHPPPGLLVARMLEVPSPLRELRAGGLPVPQHLAEEHGRGRPPHEHQRADPAVSRGEQARGPQDDPRAEARRRRPSDGRSATTARRARATR